MWLVRFLVQFTRPFVTELHIRAALLGHGGVIGVSLAPDLSHAYVDLLHLWKDARHAAQALSFLGTVTQVALQPLHAPAGVIPALPPAVPALTTLNDDQDCISAMPKEPHASTLMAEWGVQPYMGEMPIFAPRNIGPLPPQMAALGHPSLNQPLRLQPQPLRRIYNVIDPLASFDEDLQEAFGSGSKGHTVSVPPHASPKVNPAALAVLEDPELVSEPGSAKLSEIGKRIDRPAAAGATSAKAEKFGWPSPQTTPLTPPISETADADVPIRSHWVIEEEVPALISSEDSLLDRDYGESKCILPMLALSPPRPAILAVSPSLDSKPHSSASPGVSSVELRSTPSRNTSTYSSRPPDVLEDTLRALLGRLRYIETFTSLAQQARKKVLGILLMLPKNQLELCMLKEGYLQAKVEVVLALLSI